ncbi:MAG: DUF6273 domain-containing protein [Propionibacteriaceae bacterium]|jgi:tetratricopeptide (TPR) repeat protein|nr:DUF6273 domain-containing protein [Propionibacteriaceae bacterium]
MAGNNERLLREAEAAVNGGGGPVWVALRVDQTNRRALFVAREVVASRPYNKEDVAITWEGCSLRTWLNSAFFDSLPPQVKSRVVEVTNWTRDNREYVAYGGNATKDRVFLLSLDEVDQYFKGDDDRVERLTGSWDFWWLRSPGRSQSHAAYVGSRGYVNSRGHSVAGSGDVRPAVWLDLDDQDQAAQRQADYERYCSSAADYYEAQRFDWAEVAIGNALKNAPVGGADLKLCKLASLTYFALGKYDSALTYVNQAIVRTPDDSTLYWLKFQVSSQLGRTTPDDRRGSRDTLVDVLQITIREAETAGDDRTLALALSALAEVIFAGPRGTETRKQARQLAVRALAIDSTLEQASKVLATVKAEKPRLKAAEAMINIKGGPVWVLLDVDQDCRRALFITRDIVRQKRYNKAGGGDITWEGCSLRKWLNRAFFDSLPTQVKSRVNEMTNQNPDDELNGTKGGNSTKDRVFLLSVDEAKRYFRDAKSRVACFKGEAGCWWLRSPGSYQIRAAFVIASGYVDNLGAYVGDEGGGVRPALWLDLEE